MNKKSQETLIREIYRNAREGVYEKRFRLPRHALATVEPQGNSLTLMLTPRVEKANLEDLTADIEMLTIGECTTRILTSLHGYCEMYQNRNPWVRAPQSQEFFEHVFRERQSVFRQESPIYRSVVLYENGDVRGRVDFVQEGLVAQTDVASASKQTRSKKRARKNSRMRSAQQFFAERYEAAMRAFRIDGEHTGNAYGIIRCTDIDKDEGRASIASFK